MVITCQTTHKLKFPAYIISSSNWEESDGLLFLDNKLLDDKNMPGDTLGLRRLQTPFKDLYPLKSYVGSLLGLIKQPINTFIDTNGTPFMYEKTQYCALKYYKITKIERKEVASVLWLSGINIPFKIPRPPGSNLPWAGILHKKEMPWMLYEYSSEKRVNTRRKV